MQESEDISYSDQVESKLDESDGVDSQSNRPSARIVNGMAVIDEGTLARLVDECREEQESRSLVA